MGAGLVGAPWARGEGSRQDSEAGLLYRQSLSPPWADDVSVPQFPTWTVGTVTDGSEFSKQPVWGRLFRGLSEPLEDEAACGFARQSVFVDRRKGGSGSRVLPAFLICAAEEGVEPRLPASGYRGGCAACAGWSARRGAFPASAAP